jgi:hypothetical protein
MQALPLNSSGSTSSDSPTYNGTDLDALSLGMQDIQVAQTVAHIRALDDRLWREIAANYFAPRTLLAGPFSRTYDFFEGAGILQRHLYMAGLSTYSGGADLSSALLLQAQLDNVYQPPLDALCETALPMREVASIWAVDGGPQGKFRTAYITPDYTLGSTSSNYTTSLSSVQDLPFVAELPNGYQNAIVSVLPDYRDAPGESAQAVDFNKVTHLQINPVGVQKNGELLATVLVPATDPGYTFGDGGPEPLVNLSTNVTFPRNADAILWNGQPVGVDAGFTSSNLSVGDTLSVAVGNGVITVSVLSASGVECPSDGGFVEQTSAPSSITIKPLVVAGTGPLGRLAIYHATTLPSDLTVWSKCFARATLLIAGESCPGGDGGCAASFSAFQQSVAASANETWNAGTGDWSVAVSFPDGGEPQSLSLERSAANGKIISQLVDGSPIAFAPLQLNGTPILLILPDGGP